MTEYELELLEEIRYYLKEIVVQVKKTNRLLGGSCSVADNSLNHPAKDMNAPINGDYPGKWRSRHQGTRLQDEWLGMGR